MASTDVSRTIRAIRGVKRAYAPKIADGLVKCAEVVLRKSNTIVPVDKGELQESGHVISTGKGFGARATVVYDAPHAVYVHEDLEAHHAPGKEAKFLEKAARLTKGTQVSILKRSLETK